MHLHLTEDERREVRQARPEPARLTDPETQQEYVLLPAEVYERLRALLIDEGEIEVERGYALTDEVFREDWDDPKMAEYDRYDEHKP